MENWIEILIILSMISSVATLSVIITLIMFIIERRYQHKSKKYKR